MSQKSYDGTPSLYLIPTPIGNMEDITVRAINTIKEVDLILTEDTRVTGQLLRHFDIKKKMISNHEHNENENKKLVIEALKNGKNIGLISDRGTPVISDPGYEIAKHVIDNGYNVIALPGATALIPALIVSGITPSPFTFYGFLNSKATKRQKELELLCDKNETLIFYESPHRVFDTLKDIKKVLGDREISISREISKKYEEVYRGSVNEVLTEIEGIKGEIVIIVSRTKQNKEYTNAAIVKMVRSFIDIGKKPNEAIKETSIITGVAKNKIYDIYHNHE